MTGILINIKKNAHSLVRFRFYHGLISKTNEVSSTSREDKEE